MAGVIDGEGTIGIYQATSKHRMGWQLVVSQYQAAPLLLGCREHLQVKRAQADLAPRYTEECSPAEGRLGPSEAQVVRRHWYWDETRRLNRRGPPE